VEWDKGIFGAYRGDFDGFTYALSPITNKFQDGE
jgi:hypothetical protein